MPGQEEHNWQPTDQTHQTLHRSRGSLARIPIPKNPELYSRHDNPKRPISGMDDETWRLLRTAGVIACLSLGVPLALSLLQEDPAKPVPVVAPPAGPVRVRPDRPGGMEIVGSLDEAFDTDEPVVLAPAPEEPALAALQAQAESGWSAMQEQEPGEPTTPTAIVTSVADTDEAQDVRTRATSAEVPRPAPHGLSTPRGTYQVQLAALESERAARAELARLRNRLPQILGARAALIQPAKRNGVTVWRLRITEFSHRLEAQQFCESIQAAGAGCVVASF